MEQFLTWEQLAVFTVFVGTVYMIVEFIKEMPGVKKIKTKYISAIISFTLLMLISLRTGTFIFCDIPLYIINSLCISFSANGIANLNKKGGNDNGN